MGKRKWTYDEDYLCCERYIHMYCIKQHEPSIIPLLKELSSLLPHFSVDSLRRNIQNIKHLTAEKNIYDSLDYAPNDHCPPQCRMAFDEAIANTREELLIYIADD